MREVTLEEILASREERVRIQRELLGKYRCPVISFTMNIAGPIKTSPLIERAFKEGLTSLELEIPKEKTLYSFTDYNDCGCFAIYAVSQDAEELKKICVAIEEGSHLGRLFDMDVINTDGIKLDRGTPRRCIVCGREGKYCAAGRLHSAEELQRTTTKIITEHFKLRDRKRFARIASESLIKEVLTTPKPGLVDRDNNGSHTDMNAESFIKSAIALNKYFSLCVGLGQDTSKKKPEDSFPPLRRLGLEAEREMYATTGGVNTHKGAIYSIGILLCATGRLWTPELPVAATGAILKEAAAVAKSAVEKDFATQDGSTAGGRLYIKHGKRGIRGEVADGFPSVLGISLPVYEKSLKAGFGQNDAGVLALIHLIASVYDTNLYARGKEEGVDYARSYAKELLKLFQDYTAKETDTTSKRLSETIRDKVKEMDEAFIHRNLSPGGCADLLAITYLLHELAQL